MANKQAKGKVSIGRYIGKDLVHLSVTDVLSGVEFVDVEMDLKSFASCLMGQGYVDAKFVVRGLDKLGTRHENKTEIIKLPKSYTDSVREMLDAEIGEALSPFEVDGWKGERGDFKNWHRIKRVGEEWHVTVAFHRWVTVT